MARVHVLDGYSGGRPVRRFLCFRCADVADPAEQSWEAPSGERRLTAATLAIFAGAALMFLGGFADVLHFWHGSAGIGWLQRSGFAGGVLLLITGALLRVDLVAVGGALMFALAAVADLSGTVGSPGFGWRQALLIAFGLGLAAAGSAYRIRKVGWLRGGGLVATA